MQFNFLCFSSSDFLIPAMRSSVGTHQLSFLHPLSFEYAAFNNTGMPLFNSENFQPAPEWNIRLASRCLSLQMHFEQR